MKLNQTMAIITKVNSSNYSRFLDKLSRRVLSLPKQFFFSFINRNYNKLDAIVIFSEARGGSTWVMEQVQNLTNAISIFEPLWGKNGKFKDISQRFSSPFYFGNEESEDLLRNFIDHTLSGKKTSWRTIQFNSFNKLWDKNVLCVKMVNVNLIAPWFAENYKLTYRPIYLIRHPLAILSSGDKYNYDEKNLGIATKYSINWKRIKSTHHPYLEYKNLLDEANSRYEKYLIGWCIRNYKFLSEEYSNDFLIIYYEDLVLQPNETLNKIAEHLNADINVSEINLRASSGTTSLNDNVKVGLDQINKWKNHFNEEQLEKFQNIFNQFGITNYSTKSGLPKHLQDLR